MPATQETIIARYGGRDDLTLRELHLLTRAERYAADRRAAEWDAIAAERETTGLPMDMGSLTEWDAMRGMESVAVDSPIPDKPESATYRRGRKVGGRGTVVRRSAVSEHRNLYVVGADDERGYVCELAANLEARADMLLMHDAATRHHDETCECDACAYPAGVRTIGTATRSWGDTSPEGMAGMLQHVAWHHDTMADTWASVTGLPWHVARRWSDMMGADPPTRRTDRDKVQWSDSTVSTLRHAVRSADGEYVLDDDGRRTYAPTVLAEVGAWRDGRHWQVTLYGTVLTTWTPAGSVETIREHAVGGGWRQGTPRKLIRGADGRLVRGKARRIGRVLPGETVQTWQSAGRHWHEHTGTVRRTTVRILVKRARLTYRGGAGWEGATQDGSSSSKAGRRLTAAATAARTRKVLSPEAIHAAIADLDPGARVRLNTGKVVVAVRRLPQSDPVYRMAIGATRGQRRRVAGAVAWITERI